MLSKNLWTFLECLLLNPREHKVKRFWSISFSQPSPFKVPTQRMFGYESHPNLCFFGNRRKDHSWKTTKSYLPVRSLGQRNCCSLAGSWVMCSAISAIQCPSWPSPPGAPWVCPPAGAPPSPGGWPWPPPPPSPWSSPPSSRPDKTKPAFWNNKTNYGRLEVTLHLHFAN